jgi:hypothetical protein
VDSADFSASGMDGFTRVVRRPTMENIRFTATESHKVIPMENLDLLVDPRGRKLIGNPEHGGEHMFEMY